jgi:hypothetical protein
MGREYLGAAFAAVVLLFVVFFEVVIFIFPKSL